jgi:hypothetical protein
MKVPFEKLFLVLALFTLGAGATVAALMFPPLEEILGQAPSPKSNPVKPVDPTELKKIQEGWGTPPQWQPSKLASGADHPLFVGRELLYFPDTYDIKVISGDVLIEGKFPLSWLRQYKIDYSKPGWRLEDADGDGFSNELEFDEKTDPLDPNSHSPLITRLRLKQYTFKPFRIRLQAVNELEGQEVYQINLRDAVKKSRFAKKGDEVEGFKVGEFRKKIVTAVNDKTKEEETKDLSELDLYNEVIDYKVTLILGKDIDSRDSSAEFVMLLPKEVEAPFQIKRGAVKNVHGTDYRLKDINETMATLIQLPGNEAVTIPLLNDGEMAQVPRSAATENHP